MRRRYRRIEISRADEAGAIAVGILVGAGAAAVSYYLTRLFLSRDPIGPDVNAVSAAPTPSSPSLPPGDAEPAS